MPGFSNILLVAVPGEDPTRAIARVGRLVKRDLIVMGTVGRVGIPGLLIGNTAERILGDMSCSVLAVKPQGFVAPVSPAECQGEGRMQ